MKLSVYMEKKKLKFEDVAEIVGTTHQQVKHWYHGVFSPRLAHAIIINKVTNGEVKLEDLLTDNDKQRVKEMLC